MTIYIDAMITNLVCNHDNFLIRIHESGLSCSPTLAILEEHYLSQKRFDFVGVLSSFIAQNPHDVGYKMDHGVGQTRHVAPDQKNAKTWPTYWRCY